MKRLLGQWRQAADHEAAQAAHEKAANAFSEEADSGATGKARQNLERASAEHWNAAAGHRNAATKGREAERKASVAGGGWDESKHSRDEKGEFA